MNLTDDGGPNGNKTRGFDYSCKYVHCNFGTSHRYEVTQMNQKENLPWVEGLAGRWGRTDLIALPTRGATPVNLR